MPLYKKGHHFRSVQFNSACPLAFDNVASVGAAAANTTVQARLNLPQRCKILRVSVNVSAIGSGGAHSINIVQGTGAEGSAGTVDAIASAGTVVFSADQAITSITPDTPITLYPSVMDTVFDTNTLLTLRAVTPATTGSLTNLKVTLLVMPMDATSGANTMNTNSDGSIGFGPYSF